MYHLIKQEGAARRGRFETVHGTVQTPAFMNVATAGAIKGAVSAYDLKDLHCQVQLCNTYHLHLRPGDETVKKLGGIRKFTGWDGPVLTDSGGFQVFSLAKLRYIKEEGVTFASHVDGHKIFMGPEESMRFLDVLLVERHQHTALVDNTVAVITTLLDLFQILFGEPYVRAHPPAAERVISDAGELLPPVFGSCHLYLLPYHITPILYLCSGGTSRMPPPWDKVSQGRNRLRRKGFRARSSAGQAGRPACPGARSRPRQTQS